MKIKFKYFIISSLCIVGLLLICLSQTNQSDKSKDQTKHKSISEYVISAYEKVKGEPLIIEGVIVDQDGSPLNEVSVKIIKVKTDFMKPLNEMDIIEEEKKVVDSQFSLKYIGYHGMEVTFTKKGYYSHQDHVQLEAPELTGQPLTKNIKTNLRIVLKYMGEATRGLYNHTMKLIQSNKDGNWKRQGWTAVGYTDNKDYSNPSEVDLYAEVDAEGNLWMIATPPAGLILLDHTVPNFDPRDINKAPEEGYVTRVKIQPKSQAFQYLYFRSKKGGYGKIKINWMATYIQDKDCHVVGHYYFNPTGRDLVTGTF
jgi:hypothetical protein